MQWKKLGKIFEPDGSVSWMKTHATIPIAEHLSGDQYKVYFTPRDELNRSHVAWVTIDMKNPTQVIDSAKNPLLAPGPVGSFDDSGAMANCLVNLGDKKYFYYQGCNLGTTVPFRNSVGLAISHDGGKSYEKLGGGPILERTYKEPHFCATAEVKLEDNNLFRMWYLSCVNWEMVDGKPKHYYHIKYAESNDGIDWKRKGTVAIDFKNKDEYAIGVPRIIKENGLYKMWYCYRGDRYRIGYAESQDGIGWKRKDEEMDFDVSASGWDSEMVQYAYIFDHAGKRYMLYNGNGYGKTGVGIAVLAG